MTYPVIATVVMADPARKEGCTCVLLIDGYVWAPLLNYFHQHVPTVGRQRPIGFAVCRFIQWLSRKGKEYQEISKRNEVFAGFGDDVLFGTVRDGEDSSGLWWEGTSANNCRLILRRLLNFCDWLESEYGIRHMNPWSETPSVLDQILFWRHWAKTKDGSVLAHIKARENAPTDRIGRTYQYPVRETVSLRDPKAFPEDLIESFLAQGFMKAGLENQPDVLDRMNLRDILITMLCLYGGLRTSEALQLWVPDVYEHPYSPGVARVYVYHPSHGVYRDPKSKKRWLRSDYLDQVCGGKLPLNLESGRKRAGWKGLMFTDSRDQYAQVYWIDEKYGRLFLKLWDQYLRRDRCTSGRPDWTTTPWAFLNENNVPMGTLMYIDSFHRALRRMGLVPQKSIGLTPHGLRHRYGRWMAALNLDKKTQQIMLHHRSAASSDVYASYTPQFVEKEVRGRTLADSAVTGHLNYLEQV